MIIIRNEREQGIHGKKLPADQKQPITAKCGCCRTLFLAVISPIPASKDEEFRGFGQFAGCYFAALTAITARPDRSGAQLSAGRAVDDHGRVGCRPVMSSLWFSARRSWLQWWLPWCCAAP